MPGGCRTSGNLGTLHYCFGTRFTATSTSGPPWFVLPPTPESYPALVAQSRLDDRRTRPALPEVPRAQHDQERVGPPHAQAARSRSRLSCRPDGSPVSDDYTSTGTVAELNCCCGLRHCLHCARLAVPPHLLRAPTCGVEPPKYEPERAGAKKKESVGLRFRAPLQRQSFRWSVGRGHR